MRVEKEIHEFGYFTLDRDKQRKFPGYLSIEKDGETEIRIYYFSNDNKKEDFLRRAKVIEGELQNYKYIYTDKFRYPLINSCQALDHMQSTYKPPRFCCDYHVNQLLIASSPILTSVYKTVTFDMDGLLQWHGYDDKIQNIIDDKKAGYAPIQLYKDNDVELSFVFGATEKLEMYASQQRKAFTRLHLVFSKYCKVCDIARYIDIFSSFLLFVNDEEMNIALPYKLGKNECPDPKNPTENDVYLYSSNWKFPNCSLPKYQYNSLFDFQTIQKSTQSIISAWIKVYSDASTSLSLYFRSWIASNIKKELLVEPLLFAIEAIYNICVQNEYLHKYSENQLTKKEYDAFIEYLEDCIDAKYRNKEKISSLKKKVKEIHNGPSYKDKIARLIKRNCPPKIKITDDSINSIASFVRDVRVKMAHSLTKNGRAEDESKTIEKKYVVSDLLYLIYKTEMLRILGIREKKIFELLERNPGNAIIWKDSIEIFDE